MISFFQTFLYEPLLNGLFFLVNIIPGNDIGIAVVVLTIIVKFIIFPFTHKSTKSQSQIKALEPEIKDIKEKHKEDKAEQARKTMELYQKHGVNPFVGCVTVFVQLPAILALYWVFLKGLSFDPSLITGTEHTSGYIHTSLLNTESLYSFISIPDFIKIKFLSIIDMTKKSILLALAAGVTQYVQIKFSMPGDVSLASLKSSGSLKDDLAQSMKFQMRYIMPVFVVVFAYTISAAVALYWTTSNMFSIIHELIVRKKAKELMESDNNK